MVDGGLSQTSAEGAQRASGRGFIGQLSLRRSELRRNRGSSVVQAKNDSVVISRSVSGPRRNKSVESRDWGITSFLKQTKARARAGLGTTARITFTSSITVSVSVASSSGRVAGPALPSACTPDGPISVKLCGDAIAGVVRIDGIGDPIPFAVGPGKNSVGDLERMRAVVVHGSVAAGGGFQVEGDGVAAELQVTDGPTAEITVSIRKATETELRRFAALRALQEAEQKKTYNDLHAQIAKARTRGVEQVHIDRAEKLLKTLKPDPGTYLCKQTMKDQMRWDKITERSEEPESVTLCSATEGCSCNEPFRGNEQLEITTGLVNQAIHHCAPKDTTPERWLFEGLVSAAMAAPEGCVWKAGGKYIMSSTDRNQSPAAVLRLLESIPEAKGGVAKGMRALVNFTEARYSCNVTAVQVNFHPDQTSFHAQHRDIFSAKQRGGLNCTCSFRTCVGTACYSVGSSRVLMLDTMTDEFSSLEACGEDCTRRSERRWVDNGALMYFNDAWNLTHTHGVPQCTHDCGPRISIALLCS